MTLTHQLSSAPAYAGPGVDVDPITYEVVRHRLLAIVAQQSAVLKNVSGSPLVTEANDCNTGIYLPDGQIAAMGPHIVFHSGSMEVVVANILEDCGDNPGINEGDVFITNDPYSGALHLPDVTMLEPVIHDGMRIGWVGSCCHVLDIGGMTPSSWCPDARETFQEGLIIPPTKLVEAGRTRSDVWRLILSASRLPANVGLDLRAMIAANTHARKGLLRLIDRYDVDVVMTVMHTMLDNSEVATRERIRSLPEGTFRARNYFDHDGHEDNVARIEVELTKVGDELVFDYSASSPQMPGIFNCTISGLRGGVFAAALPVIAHDIPWNSGIMRAIRVEASEGLVVNAKHPAPCGGATVGGAFMVKNTAHSALSSLASVEPTTRGEAMATTTGAIQVFHIGGLNQYGYPFGGAVTEALAGGGGATAEAHGIDYAGPHEILTYQITNVEGDESAFPLLWLRREINTDSGGAGRTHGGAGLSGAFTVHDANFVHGVLAVHSLSMPSSTGLHGGLPGATHRSTLARGTDVAAALAGGLSPQGFEDLEGHVTDFAGSPGELMLFPGDVLDWSVHGGGGWGDALDAEPSAVLEEVLRARISVAAAECFYGVVISDGELSVEATDTLRAARREQRRGWPRTKDARMPSLPPESMQTLGDRLALGDQDGRRFFGCTCGHTLAPATENWKEYAAHSTLAAEDLGAKVRLHRELTADGYACPACGGLLAVEIRWSADEPLHEVQLREH